MLTSLEGAQYIQNTSRRFSTRLFETAPELVWATVTLRHGPEVNIQDVSSQQYDRAAQDRLLLGSTLDARIEVQDRTANTEITRMEIPGLKYFVSTSAEAIRRGPKFQTVNLWTNHYKGFLTPLAREFFDSDWQIVNGELVFVQSSRGRGYDDTPTSLLGVKYTIDSRMEDVSHNLVQVPAGALLYGNDSSRSDVRDWFDSLKSEFS